MQDQWHGPHLQFILHLTSASSTAPISRDNKSQLSESYENPNDVRARPIKSCTTIYRCLKRTSMWNGGYFPNWRGCLNCQYVHGTRSEAVAEAFDNILSSASQQFCTGTPTAVFADYFSALSDSSPQTATGAATTTSDQFPSQSAVSLYYTASGNQGPGAITGSAAQATATASAASASSGSLAASAATTSAARTSGASSSAKSSSGSMTSARSSGSSSGSAASAASTSAAQTGAANAVAVSEGLLAVVAGAMMLL